MNLRRRKIFPLLESLFDRLFKTVNYYVKIIPLYLSDVFCDIEGHYLHFEKSFTVTSNSLT